MNKIKIGTKVKTRNIDLIVDGWISPQNTIIEDVVISNTPKYGMRVNLEKTYKKLEKRKTLVYLYRYEFIIVKT